MKTPVDARLREEARQFAFRFSCDDCLHAGTIDGVLRCSLGYGASPRADALGHSHLELCKTFELG